MGCAYSKCSDEDISCVVATTNTTTINVNELDVDISHFNVSSKALGVGGFGIVRSAQKLTGNDKGTEYAMKTMCKSSILKRTSGPQCVLTELRALVILSHCKFVCNIHYGFQDTSHLYMAIDIAHGGDMRYNLRSMHQTRFPEGVARVYICQVLIALEYCHQASILHRGYLKLTDFGVAKILSNIEDCRSTSGTHGYMAPEIYEGEHIHGTPAEWFATGVTLHEFLTGRRPFEVYKLQSYRGYNRYPEDLSLEFLDSCNYLTLECKDFLHLLLRAKSACRLGSLEGLSEMSSHPWLEGVDWSGLREQRYPAPYLPDVSQTRCDISAEDMKKVVQQSLLAQPLSEREQLVFAQYEYRTKINSKSDSTTACPDGGEDCGGARKVSAARRTVSVEGEVEELSVLEKDSRHPCRKRAKMEPDEVGVDRREVKQHRVTAEDDDDEPETVGKGLHVQQPLTAESDGSSLSRINQRLSGVLKDHVHLNEDSVRVLL